MHEVLTEHPIINQYNVLAWHIAALLPMYTVILENPVRKNFLHLLVVIGIEY